MPFAGGDGRFDHGGGGAHFREALNLLEDVFFEAGLAGGDLELRGSGDAVDGFAEGGGDALIRGVHADEDADAEDDAGRGQQPAQQMFARVGPTDEPQQPHARDTS